MPPWGPCVLDDALISRSDQASEPTSPVAGVRIVVIGINFAPELTGIGPYTTEMCRQLSGAGALVHMVTGVPHYPSWSVSRHYRRRLLTTESYGTASVTRARHYVPRSQSSVKRACFEATFMASSHVAARRLDADVVLAVTPNLGALPVAAAVARRNAAPMGAIVQDLIGRAGKQSGIRGASSAAALAGRLEARWLNAADSVGVISRDFVPPLLAAGLEERRVQYLPNYTHITPDPRGQAASRRALGWPVDGFYVVHTGNMGLKQDLGNVVATARLAEARGSQVRFVFVGDGSQRRVLEEASVDVRCVSVVPPLHEAQYPTALAAADVLLVNERATVIDMSLPSKLTSYLAAGRPVVAAVHVGGATAQEVNRSGGGLVTAAGNPAALLDALDLLAGDESLRRTLAAAGSNYAKEHLSSRSAEERMIRFVAELVGRERRFPSASHGGG